QQWADSVELGWVPLDHGVGVPDIDGRETDAVDLLGLTDQDRRDLLLDEAAAEHPCLHLALVDPDRDRARPGLAGEPCRRDPRAVAGHLGWRAVRIPDPDLQPVLAAVADLEDPVRVTHLGPDEVRCHGALSYEIDVALRLPTR